MSDPSVNDGPWWEAFAMALAVVVTVCFGALIVALTIFAIRWLI